MQGMLFLVAPFEIQVGLQKLPMKQIMDQSFAARQKET
jgi:hypothetical protein